MRAIRCAYLSALIIGLLWIWNPIHLVAIRAHDLVGLRLVPTAIAGAIAAEGLTWRRPRGGWRSVFRAAVAVIAAYVGFVGAVVFSMASTQITVVASVQIATRRVVVIDESLLIDICRRLEIRSGSGLVQRFSHSSKCLAQGGPISLQRASAPGAEVEVDVEPRFCDAIPKGLDTLRLRCVTPQ